MKKVLKYIFLLVMSICFITGVKAYNVSSNNNPGINYNNSGASLSGTTTIWPSPYLKVVRIRIFRGKTVIGDKYYSIVNDESSCYSGVSSTKVCESSGYDYSNVTDSTGVSCTDKDLSFGCIATSNLNSSWSVDSYNGTYLDNYLKNTNYINLKSILEGMGYNNTNFKNDDIVIVEPATLVRCAGTSYFGTSTALMKKNVSYRGSSGNQCSSNDKYKGYTFQNVFQSMSTAFKQTNCSSATKTSYDGCGYFKYNVSNLGYVDPYGDIIVSIVDSSGALINTTAKFKLVKGDNCDTGVFVDKKDTGISGTLTFSNLNLEQYSVCQEQAPIGYKETPISMGGKKQTGTLTSSGLNFTFIYEKDCTAKLNDLGSNPTINQLLNLYNEYPSFNNLLNFDNPSCSVKKCDSSTKTGESLITGCLTATGETSSFTEKDLSCYDEKYSDYTGFYNGFCKNTLDLKNNLGVNKFYANAGQFLIQKTSTNIYKIYDENLNPVEINSQYVSTATLKKDCYILNGSATYINEELPTISLYFNDEENELNYDKVDNTPSVSYKENFTKYTYSTKYNYKLNNIYLEKLTGKVFKEKSDLTTDAIEAISSNFVANEGNIYFDLIYNGKNAKKNSDYCTYSTKHKIVKDNNLDLELRLIDTKNPFNRKTKSNWCDGNDCSKDNNIVKQYIINSVNSYGLDNDGNKHEPLYKIILDSDSIKTIRKYNETNQYSYYKLINKDGNLVNAFVYDLKNGALNQYKEDGSIDYSFGNLKYKLEGTKTK